MTSTMLYKSSEGQAAAMAIYDEALGEWSAPHTTLTIHTRHGDTFIIASGDILLPPLILLHGGGGGNSSMWAGDVGPYSRHFRVYAVDMPGEAGRSAPNRPEWEGAAFAEWLEDVLDGLKIEHTTLVGLSQGGWTALKFAVAHPDRVEKLVVMSPGGIIPDRPSFILYALVMVLTGKRGIRRMVNALFGDQPVPTEVADRVTQVTAAFKPRVGLLPIFPDDELRRLSMPVLLLGGDKDIMRDLNKIADRLHRLLPDLTVDIIPGGGHALVNTSGRIIAFLTQHKALRPTVSQERAR
jgi:pimeloyl-ACP methyl ester carboxylesterase